MREPQLLPSIADAGDRLGPAVAGHLDATFRALLSNGPSVVRDRRFVRLTTGAAHPFGNFAVVANASDVEGTRAALDPFSNSSVPSAVVFLEPQSADVLAYLRERGFAPHDPMPTMAVDIHRLASTSPPDGCVFRRMVDDATVERWAEAFAAGYGLPLVVAREFAPAPGRLRREENSPAQYFAVVRDGVIVGTSLLHLNDGLAGIYCVATVEAERGKGIGAHLTAEPLRLAHQMGYRVGALQSSQMGLPVYRRLGFVELGKMPLEIRIPAA